MALNAVGGRRSGPEPKAMSCAAGSIQHSNCRFDSAVWQSHLLVSWAWFDGDLGFDCFLRLSGIGRSEGDATILVCGPRSKIIPCVVVWLMKHQLLFAEFLRMHRGNIEHGSEFVGRYFIDKRESLRCRCIVEERMVAHQMPLRVRRRWWTSRHSLLQGVPNL
jgi:hypothetical protein